MSMPFEFRGQHGTQNLVSQVLLEIESQNMRSSLKPKIKGNTRSRNSELDAAGLAQTWRRTQISEPVAAYFAWEPEAACSE